MGAPGIGAGARPRRRGCRRARSRGSGCARAALVLVDMHLLAAAAGLLGDRQVDHAVLDRGHADDQRPIDLAARCAPKRPWRRYAAARVVRATSSAPRYPCRAGGRAWAGSRRRTAAPSSRPSTCSCVLVPPCVARPGGLLSTIACVSRWITISRTIVGLVVAQRRALALLGGASAWTGSAGGTRIDWPATIRSPGVARVPSTRSCPVRAHCANDGEAGIGQMPLEPAIEPDAVVVGADGELADFAVASCRHPHQRRGRRTGPRSIRSPRPGYSSAAVARSPRCIIVTTSSEKAEKVVKPPSTPTPSSSRQFSPGADMRASAPTSSPIAKPPIRFTASVPKGKAGPNSASVALPVR